MYTTKYAIIAMLSCAGMIVSSGCGKARPTTTPVAGRVTCQGNPVTAGRIIFQPDDGRRPASGIIGPDGSYRLTTFAPGDGAFIGKHRVSINAMRVVGGPGADFDNPAAAAFAQPSRIEWLVPEKYANPETSNLAAEVKPGKNDINFDL